MTLDFSLQIMFQQDHKGSSIVEGELALSYEWREAYKHLNKFRLLVTMTQKTVDNGSNRTTKQVQWWWGSSQMSSRSYNSALLKSCPHGLSDPNRSRPNTLKRYLAAGGRHK
ncbi:hypothetical protein CEXT_255091 [Caerostris extrusa]|uniref:Uncharacterized protein n=1 Tax=Caerostris extrusa TaxID=172846 RepID=A0AAV4Y3Y8_CAEEX|nr:hypothetical protein CEXT_255091 [Caerostris extrusa]